MRAVALVLGSTLLAVSCTTTVPGPEASPAQYEWFRGELKDTLSSPLPEVEQATRRAFQELDLVGVVGEVDGLVGELEARMAIGTKVRVRLRALDFDSTVVKIRVGKVGDRSISMQLLRHISKQLGVPTT